MHLNRLLPRGIPYFCSVLWLLTAVNGFAYSEQDHLVLSKRAALQSVIGANPNFVRSYGLSAWGENRFINTVDNTANNKITDLIGFGAMHEDDLVPDIRVLNHFYDPQYDGGVGRGLSVSFLGGEIGRKSPDWALEDHGDVVTIGALYQLPGRPQIYSLKEARVYFLAALNSPTLVARETNFARLFQALGHVVHHIQDMAQPQHTRNESHSFFEKPEKFFEEYTQTSRYLRDSEYRESGRLARRNELLRGDLNSWGNFPVPAAGSFAAARHFWVSPDSSSLPYRGMAEYTARNFLSSRTGFRIDESLGLVPDEEFAYPNGMASYMALPELVEIVQEDGTVITEYATLIKTSIYDGYLNQSFADVPVAAYSLLTDHGADITVVNRFVYEQQYPLLLPRAVAFSAGLINHFFRGRLTVERNSDDLSKWDITNVGGQRMTGQFTAYHENASGHRQPVAAGPWSRSLNAGATFQVSFPEPLTVAEKIVVTFAGNVGAEAGVAGRVADFDQLPELDVRILEPSVANKVDWRIRNDTASRLTGEFRLRSYHGSGETYDRVLGVFDLAPGATSPVFRGSKLGNPISFEGEARVLFEGTIDGSAGEFSLQSAKQDLPRAPAYRMNISAEANSIGIGWVDYDQYDSLGDLLDVIADVHLDVQVPASQSRTVERRYWPNHGVYGDIGSPQIFCLGPLNSWCDYSVRFYAAESVACVSNPFAPDGTPPYETPLDSRLRAVTATVSDWPKVASWCLENQSSWP